MWDFISRKRNFFFGFIVGAVTYFFIAYIIKLLRVIS
jgi:hypothetical protein